MTMRAEWDWGFEEVSLTRSSCSSKTESPNSHSMTAVKTWTEWPKGEPARLECAEGNDPLV